MHTTICTQIITTCTINFQNPKPCSCHQDRRGTQWVETGSPSSLLHRRPEGRILVRRGRCGDGYLLGPTSEWKRNGWPTHNNIWTTMFIINYFWNAIGNLWKSLAGGLFCHLKDMLVKFQDQPFYGCWGASRAIGGERRCEVKRCYRWASKTKAWQGPYAIESAI